MPDPKQIPHLLRLLDDESPTVRKAVADALSAFGPSLEQKLFQLREPPDEGQLQRIRDILKVHSSGESPPRGTVVTEPVFKPGQLVRHRRYNYRGVVVAFDLTCQADDDWYLSNKSQPKKSQPWYHVLVHDSHQITYAAQTSLEEDNSGKQVVHPLLSHLFSAFSDGQYIRNDRPWPNS